MLKLEDVIKALEGLENGADLIAAFKAELTKKNNEAANLRKRAKAAEDLNAGDKKTLLKVLEKLGIEDADSEEFDLDEALEAYDTAMKANGGGKGKTKDDPEFAELQRQVSKLTKMTTQLQSDKAASEKAASDERLKRHGMLTRNELLTQLTEGKAIKPGTLVDILMKHVKVNEDESLVFIDEVGSEVGVKEGVAGWLTANPEFVANTSSGGAGSAGGAGGGKKTEVENAKQIAADRNKGPQAGSTGLNPWGTATQA